MKTEFNIGETFKFGLVTLKCVQNDNHESCDGCYLYKVDACAYNNEYVGPCVASRRKDKENVIFVKVENV